jgi:hypothetical protein
MQHLDKAAITDRMRGALLTFKAMHNRLLRAHEFAKALSAADTEAFWAGAGRSSKQNADAAAWWVATTYRAYLAAGLAGSTRISERALVLAANQHLDREAGPPWGDLGRSIARAASGPV